MGDIGLFAETPYVMGMLAFSLKQTPAGQQGSVVELEARGRSALAALMSVNAVQRPSVTILSTLHSEPFADECDQLERCHAFK